MYLFCCCCCQDVCTFIHICRHRVCVFLSVHLWATLLDVPWRFYLTTVLPHIIYIHSRAITETTFHAFSCAKDSNFTHMKLTDVIFWNTPGGIVLIPLVKLPVRLLSRQDNRQSGLSWVWASRIRITHASIVRVHVGFVNIQTHVYHPLFYLCVCSCMIVKKRGNDTGKKQSDLPWVCAHGSLSQSQAKWAWLHTWSCMQPRVFLPAPWSTTSLGGEKPHSRYHILNNGCGFS